MEKGPLILHMATILEAKPFVLGMALRQACDRPFRVFETEDLILIISGIGKAHAAMAVAHAVREYSPRCLLNLGAAGASKHAFGLGDVFQVHKIFESDRMDFQTGGPVVHELPVLNGFPCATLSTSDNPVIAAGDRERVAAYADLMDMEAASFVQACRLFHTPCHVFKFVSDTPEHVGDGDIIRNIREYRTRFYEFFRKSILRTFIYTADL